MMNQRPQSYFITGTGTDVGKTIVTAGIAALCLKVGKKVGIMKPVQTGVPEFPADLTVVSSLVEGLEKLPEDIAMPYCFRLAASPHLAARDENKQIDPENIKKAYQGAMDICGDILLIEGAGGVNVPLNEDYLTLDLIKTLEVPVIIVALSGLGTINHTLLTVNQLKQAGVAVAGIIFNKMPLVPGKVELDNVKIIEKLSQVPILGVIHELSSEAGVSSQEILSEFSKQQKLKELLSF